MKINLIEKIVGSAFYTGYIPVASGTFGSMAAIVIYLIPGFENPLIMGPASILLFFWGINIGTKFEKLYGKDPSECTVDEIVGTWISLLFIPKSIIFVTIAFIVWRVLDIVKIYPANAAERLKGGLGIMLDDVISGIYTLILMQVLLYFVQ